MSKSKKTKYDMTDWATSSVMRWSSGEEVIAYLDWDETRYYLWFEPTDLFTDFCAEIGREDMYIALNNELEQIGVQEFRLLNSVNEFCKQHCGSDDPYDCAEFYEDDFGNICGA